MWMWSINNPPFLGTISPRLSESAVRLRTRWLQRRSPSQENEPKGAVEATSTAGVPPSVQRRQRNATTPASNNTSNNRSVRLVAQSAASFPIAPGSSGDASSGDSALPNQDDGSASDQDLAVDLDYAPSLGPFREMLCVVLPVLLVALLYVATGQWHAGSWVANVGSAVLAAALASLARAEWLERAYKARERVFATLGDGDSRFRPISTAAREAAAAAATAGSGRRLDTQLVVHVKVKVGELSQPSPYDGPGSVDDGDGEMQADGATRGSAPAAGVVRESVPAVHCYHGFGANLGSYKRVHEELAAVLRGVVTAHDMPGFGLTERPSDISQYFLTFNGRLGRMVLDYELQQLGMLGSPRPSTETEQQPQQAAASATAPGAPSSITAAADAMAAAVKVGSGVSSTLEAPPPGAEAVAEAAATDSSSGSSSSAAGGGGVPGAVVMTVGAPAEGGHGGLDGKGGAKQQLRRAAVVEKRAAAGGAVRQAPIKRILVGHSLGGACASLEAVTNPEGLAGLVLVAPAVVALPGPEYQNVTLSADRPSTAAGGGSGAAAAAAAAEQLRTAAARAAAQLGSEPPGSHVTDPPEVRRLYPVGQMPNGSKARGGAAGAAVGRGEGGGGAGGGARLGALARAARSLVVAAASLALLTVLRLLTPVITLLLRSLVRRRTFWVKGLQQAYYNPGAVTQDIVDSYRLPQLVSGWEAGMVNFLLARLSRPSADLGELLRQAGKQLQTTTTASVLAATAAAAAADAKAEAAAAIRPQPPTTTTSGGTAAEGGAFAASATHDSDDDEYLPSRLAALVSSRGLPVLIIHGLYDRLVPASNSQRLARMLPGCELVLLDRCGHMPQEELPGIFVNLVAEFAARLTPSGGRQ